MLITDLCRVCFWYTHLNSGFRKVGEILVNWEVIISKGAKGMEGQLKSFKTYTRYFWRVADEEEYK